MSTIINDTYVPRLINDVHKKMIIKIPDSEKEFKSELEEYIESIWNIAPEIKTGPHTYIPYFNIIIKYIPNYHNLTQDDPKWMFDCRDIFSGKNLN